MRLQFIFAIFGVCCFGVLVAIGLAFALDAVGISHGAALRRMCVEQGGSVTEAAGGFYCQRTTTPQFGVR